MKMDQSPNMKKHILLIDDDKDEWDIFRDALLGIPAAFECTWASDAEEAFRRLEDISPDFIFVDFNMPRTNGLQCLAELKKLRNSRDVPVILYSSYIDGENNRKATDMGAYRCIVKPSRIPELTKSLEEILIR